MPQCSAPNCKNRGVHVFPKDPIRRKRWENALRINNFRASATARLCSSHFKEDDYFGISNYTGAAPLAKFLRKTAVPSIFCFTKIKQETPAALKRQQRYKKRSQMPPFLHNEVIEDTPVSELLVPAPTVNPMTLVVCKEEVDTAIEITLQDESLLTEPECLSKSTQIDHELTYGSINRHKNDNKSILFYTGFQTYKKFNFVYSTLSPMAHKIRYFGSNVIDLSTEDQFFLTMMKLRQDKCIFELSKFFNISETTVSNIFITWINFMYQLWSTLNIWPSKELVEYYMPENFKKYDENVRVILDGSVITVQKPKNQASRAKPQLLGLNIIKDKELASKCVNIERIIGLTTTYKILKSELDHSYIPIASKIFCVCFMCCNFLENAS